MTTEAIDEVVEQAQSAEDGAKAFSASFEDDEQTTTPASAQTAEAKAEPKAEPEAPKFAQVTEAQLTDLLAKAALVDESRRQIDTLNGNLGGMKQVVEGLRKERKTLTPGQLKRVTAEYPELAEALQADLADLSGGPDAEEFGKRVSAEFETRMAPAVVAFETKLLRFYHRDWQQVVAAKDFKDWKASLPEGDRVALDNSNDGEFIADKLTEFKDARAKRAKEAADATAKTTAEALKNKSSDSRQRRLEAAVPPKGTGGNTTPTKATSDFQAGWDSA